MRVIWTIVRYPSLLAIPCVQDPTRGDGKCCIIKKDEIANCTYMVALQVLNAKYVIAKFESGIDSDLNQLLSGGLMTYLRFLVK